MIRRILTLLKHWREAKSALSTLSCLYDSKSDALDALGGLTAEEMKAVCDWATEETGMTVVEVGTLFGLTARELDHRRGQLQLESVRVAAQGARGVYSSDLAGNKGGTGQLFQRGLAGEGDGADRHDILRCQPPLRGREGGMRMGEGRRNQDDLRP